MVNLKNGIRTVLHMSNYEYINMSYSKDLTRINIPKFQRSLVWTEKKKNDLILTLHKDFPFGALLVAPSHDDTENLRLLDGQQRLSTINEYAKNKVRYWRNLNKDKYNSELGTINDILVSSKEARIGQTDFDKYLEPDYELGDWTDDYEGMNATTKKELRGIVKETRKEIQGYIELDKLQIPVIKFIGDENSLPDVFENLNKGGVPLTKYEILSAAWDGKIMKMPQDDENSDEILSNVKNYYTHMAANGEFDIDNFSENDITASREINLAEFGRAVGKFVVDMIPSLVSSTDNTATNELGFGLLGIISGTSNKEIMHIDKKKNLIVKNMTPNLAKIKQISQKLNDVFDALLKQKISFGKNEKSKKSQYSTGLSSSFKILSYFASLWNLDIKEMNEYLKNIPAHYVYDSLVSAWTAHGDQRLQDYYPNVASKDYSELIDKNEFKRAFDTWLSEENGMRKTFSKETKALITIHSNLTYFVGMRFSGEDFELEHIVPKARILAVDSGVTHVQLSALGNGMFLPKSLNIKKQSKTLYEYRDSMGEKGDEYDSYIQKSNYPEKEDLEQAIKGLEHGEFESTNNLISKRASQVRDVIVDGLEKID